MLAFSIYRMLAEVVAPEVLRLITLVLLRQLDLPAPLLHTTSIYVFARMQALETSVGKRLGRLRLAGRIGGWLRRIH